ncbi:MAG TPA: hypothetical protein VN540_04805 [Clostridia bacterium]|nr:hypothetical protein [Clostridia bacterium]
MKVFMKILIVIGCVCTVPVLICAALALAMISYGDVQPVDKDLHNMMLAAPPDRLIYVIGQDEKLDASGGRLIQYSTAYGDTYMKLSLPHYTGDNFDGEYCHAYVDFAKEGTYLVSFAKKQWFIWTRYFQYTVQVVSPGEYEIRLPESEDTFYYEDLEPVFCDNATTYMLSPPSNIIYPVGYTGEIDLSGIVIKAAKGWFAKKYDIINLDYTLTTDVDFNTPGSYIVRVDYTDEKGNPYWFSFTVAVAEKIGNQESLPSR